MLYQPSTIDFKWQYSNTSATRPVAAFGTVVTPVVLPNKGGWAQVVSAANMANDGYGIMICINNGATSATTRQLLVDVGVDDAGGTTYLVKIPNLLCGNASPYTAGGGKWYYFPLFIKAGSAVAVRASGTTTGVFNASVTVYGLPSRPDMVKTGTKVISYGVDATTGRGAALTLGTTAEGAWAQVGAAIGSPAPFFWQMGYTCADTTMSAAMLLFDIGVGSAASTKIAALDIPVLITAAEQISQLPRVHGCTEESATGDIVYVRGQSSTNADTSPTVAVYGCV